MKKIAAITPGKNVPSSRFRVRQYIRDLKDNKISVKEYPALIYDDKVPGILGRVRQRYIFPISASFELIKLGARLPQAFKTQSCDATWLNRTFFNSVGLESLLKKPLFFDIDDAIWINTEKHISKIAKQAATVIAGNAFIADWASQYNKNVTVIPTAVDTDTYIQKVNRVSHDFTIGWSGTFENLKFLYQIEEPLNEFLNQHKDARLLILCDRNPAFKFIGSRKVTWVKWSPENEIETLQKFDVGLMPLEDTEWAKGKCSFKMLQYMSVSIPVVVSPVGMNKEVLGKGEIGFAAKINSDWHEALNALYMDNELLKRLGSHARRVIENNYSQKIVVGKLTEVFNKGI